MDSQITAAGRALAAGDPLGALKQVALREDAAALALRGIAMAQLGNLPRARELLRSAAREFGPREVVARARCVVAEAEIALAVRDLEWKTRELEGAQAALSKHGDHVNAAHARYLETRRLLLIGRVREAAQRLASADPRVLPPALQAAHELAATGIALRRVRAKEAMAALERARAAAYRAGIPALIREVESGFEALEKPAARVVTRGVERPYLLREVEELLAAAKLMVVDACGYSVRSGDTVIALTGRPVLFALARVMGECWPSDAAREELLERAFGARQADESHRSRLRVEIARLRREVRPLSDVVSTDRGFRLEPHGDREVAVLARPVEEEGGAVLALLSDGEAWSTSALSLASGTSQRTVQRVVESMAAAGRVQAINRGRARRWFMPPALGFTTTLLLPVALAD